MATDNLGASKTNVATAARTTNQEGPSEFPDIPVFTAGSQSSGTYIAAKHNNKKYKLLFLPRECERCNQICGKLVGQGTTF